MTHTITLIPGDGIGQEVIPAARDVLESLGLPLRFQEADAGFGTFESRGDALPPDTLDRCAQSDAILFGATSSPMTKVDGYHSPILSLRRHFDLFANLRPAVGHGIDLLIVRENTEGLYSGRERLEDGGTTAITERIITARASERIVRVACQQAMLRRGQLTIVHKANVLKETCGLFRRVALDVVREFPALTVEELLVDTTAMRLVQDPARFDVIVTTNLFGDILSDLAAGLTGGLGIAPSANPRAAIFSAALLLDYLGYVDAASAVRRATYATGHTGSTQQTALAVRSKWAQQAAPLHPDRKPSPVDRASG
jgi:homoisocitrate dehydrogenase